MLSIAERLEARSIPEPNSGCLFWLGSLDSGGYGYLKQRGRHLGTHRLAWQEVNGPIPPGMVIRHKCDVPCCINPAHLLVGTVAQNVADREARNRRIAPRGEDSGVAKLTEAQALAVRDDQRPIRRIAAEHGVHYMCIWSIKRGLTWKHLPGLCT
jgi:hypothetical protein